MFLSGKVLAQAVERPDLSIELIDPKVLRVCADPNNMPFSTDKGQGFENKLAELVADKLGKGLSYSWYPQATPVVPLVKETAGPRLAYRIAMGVRYSDQEWKRQLNRTIQDNQPAIDRLLLSFGVPLLDDGDRIITEDSIPK